MHISSFLSISIKKFIILILPLEIEFMNLSIKQTIKKTLLAYVLLYFTSSVSSKAAPFFNRTGPPDSTFKSWYFTPAGVFGRNVVSKLNGRGYFKISKKRNDEVLVYKYNPAGILVNTTDVRFSNEQLALITETNQWGETYDSVWFKPADQNEYIVTEKLRGENPNIPCQALKYVFRQNLVAEIFCMMDSTKPGYNQEGVSHYVFERYSDAARFGLVKSVSFFGDIDNPVISRKTDCHKIINSYDEEGNLISKSIYGLKDEPVADRLGIFNAVMHYDKYGNETETDLYDAKSVLENQVLGYAKFFRDFKKGFLEKETCNDADFRIVKPSKALEFTAITEHKYDDNGNETERSYYNEEYKAVNNSKGIHKTVFSHNSPGMLTETSFFNDNGIAVADESGIHKYHFEKNSKGQIVSKTFFNYREQPAKDVNDGAFEVKYSYDSWGRIVSASYWANDSVKMLNKYGYHETVNSYNPNGLIATLEFFDKDGKPLVNRIGYSRQILEYNDQAQLAERKYYDRDKPVMLKDTNYFASNYHSIKYNYDNYNRVSSLEYLDDRGKPVEAKIKLDFGKETKCEKVEFVYNEKKISSELFRSDSGSTVAVDCSQKACLMPTGTGIELPNLKLLREYESSAKHQKAVGIKIDDSLFFADQLAFLNKDSLLLYLNENASGLSGKSCATFYRIAPINQYYQFNGQVSDHYIDNGNVASTLRYEAGLLNGPAIYYYKNGAIKERGEYKKNLRTGVWDYFYETGLKSKTINFTENGAFLIDCFAETGKSLAQNGNGTFEGFILAGNIRRPIRYAVTGNIKNGLQDGEWKLYNQFLNEPSNIEKFSEGKFKRGTSQSLAGKAQYYKNYLCNFESIHPGEYVNQYGQDKDCAFMGIPTSSDGPGPSGAFRDFFDEIHVGLQSILKSNRYKDYAGWVFIDLQYDEDGMASKKYVRLFNENTGFKNELLKMLESLNHQTPLKADGKRAAFERFYIVLVGANEVLIPEEVIKKQWSLQAR